MDGWNTFSFPFGARPIFRGKLAVRFREGKSNPVFPIKTAIDSTAGVFEMAGSGPKNLHQVVVLFSFGGSVQGQNCGVFVESKGGGRIYVGC